MVRLTGTPLMEKTYRELASYIAAHGYAPTQVWVAKELGCSTSAVNQLLLRMQDRGLIRLHRGYHRGIELVRRETALVA